MVSCIGMAPSGEVCLVDSLNTVAYAYRYKDLGISMRAAERAYREAGMYRSGKAEAANHLGFCAFMQMDFERAVKYHLKVYSLTKNELELLIADIGLMKVYQRTALNKEFYDYRNSALRRMRRIAEENNLFADKHERRRIDYARTEFYIVSAVYHYYLQQHPEAVANLLQVAEDESLEADTNQLLYYHYIKGAAALCDGETEDEHRLNEFDELYATWRQASRKGYLYFEGNGVQGLANLMASQEDFDYFLERRSHALAQFGIPADTLLPLRLGELALQKFRAYNDLYQIAGAYVSIGKYLNAHGCYQVALDTLRKALECVNDHHRRFYDCHDSLDWLKPHSEDSVSVEKAWIKQELKTVPEWISRIREQLSVAYAGLGMKYPSDYNRNVYLDILEDTRQDKELESRYQALEKESGELNVLLAAGIAGLMGVFVFFWFFNKRSKAKSRLHLHRLHLLMEVCREITASIPADARTEEELMEEIWKAVHPKVNELFGTGVLRQEGGRWMLSSHAGKEERAMLEVITPYIQWALENGMASIALEEERQKLEKQRYIYGQHIARNKRQNLVKKACLAIVNGIHPYIDRIVNEVHKLIEKGFIGQEELKKEKFQYIDELVTTINEYNDILSLWIKMKQGTLSLNIETFELNPLFDLLRKGGRAFEMKRQQLEVMPTDACVKADKALTLFMINTLMENARKYTPQGGKITVHARREDAYVEISVEDTGCGLSAEDVSKIVDEKVYDSQSIGMQDAANRDELRKNKGSGFGLMNCKSIIEKYRKTNALFSVCLFNIESMPGKGSRFYFRLPVGVRKAMAVLLLCSVFAGCSRTGSPAETLPEHSVEAVSPDSIADAYEEMLNIASNYANEVYYANIDGDYEEALAYADSAICYLNAHYKKYASAPEHFMALTGSGEPAELEWWNELFDSDYHVILDIRNEAAVAFLALKEWKNYSYNNTAYTTLYKLLGEDRSLEDYCQQLERSTRNKIVAVWLMVLMLFLWIAGYYLLFLRKRLINRWNLEQVLEINRQIFAASLQPVPKDEKEEWQEDGEGLMQIPQQMVNAAFDAVNELLGIDRLCMGVYNEATRRLVFASNPADVPYREWLCRCFEQQTYMAEEGRQALPLVVHVGDTSRCIGVLCLERREGTEQEGDRLLLELVVRYVSIVVFNAVVKIATKYQGIEAARDEVRRASWEDSMLHVQNLVLDNCLSTIKHETIYYPHKIKQLVGKLRSGQLPAGSADEREAVAAIGELIEYYKGIFTILSLCASRQLEEVTFRRAVIPVRELLATAEKHFRKASKGGRHRVELETRSVDAEVVGDRNQLDFLFENLIGEALSVQEDGKLLLVAETEEKYVRFFFTDRRRERNREELNQLFYPSLARMESANEKGTLCGTEYLVCKQIIREHDEFAGRRGCRINAEPAAMGGGYTVYFTLPKR